MSLNCNEINLALSELELEGAFIQDVVQPNFDTLALRTYSAAGARTLILCCAAGGCRICETRRKIPRNEKPLRFMEFLKSRIRGMKILCCAQMGLERVVRFELARGEERLLMYARLWSGAANVIVTDEGGLILDSMYRRPARGELTGGKFAPEFDEPSEEERNSALERFPIRQFEGIGGGSFNEKIDCFYSEHAKALSREALLAQAERWHAARHSRMAAAIGRLKAKQAEFRHADRLRHQGDLVLANAHKFRAGDSSLECEDFETGAAVLIRLDPKKSAQENAADLYARYKKALSGAKELEHDIAAAEKELAAHDALYEQIAREQNAVKMEQLLRKSSAPRQKAEKERPGLSFEIGGWQILVGRNAGENDELLRRFVRGQDMWLHVRDFAGGYVFIKNRPGKSVPLEILLYAGNLAVYHSKARKAGRADLYYTQVKHLRRAKNGHKGLVIPTQEKNLSIELDRDLLKKLELEQG